ncbi:EGF-like repeat and discoidin I-like domain-containing protein 3 isoform X2 [Sebastes umbrosus]|uniref:EGF-like repeat and discoidin I-like domain-containing protein 3 isoform X2 n=1 Tax=Sebastes umbrosus TaxID=72105 RepID=UPI00189D6C93|nr:EGF-like repeat and discoidin I-like domain-containing protein 3 isoform X2 [Sebastes umbrosus]
MMGPLLLSILSLCLGTAVPQHVNADGEEPTSAGPCHPNPCHNRGTCEISETYRGDTFIGYVCKCPPGFSGVHCQHNINECEREPCKNGGICTDLVANYSCECPGEYMGRNCQYRCSGPLGMEGGIISNQQITASSTHRALFGLQKWYPYFARLNKKGLVNAWTAAENDRWPWIQINLQRRMRVTGLITQGAKRIGSPEYVKSYKVAYSDDGKTWRTYKVKGKDDDMIFRGNVDNNAPSANSFTPPIEAQYVRIYPQVCRRHCTLRMELLGCELTGCSEPLGMKSGHIQDYQVTASSIFRTLNMDMFTWEPGKARLDKQGKVNAWTAGHSDQSQWLQVDLLVPTKVTGIITQGAKDFGHVQFVGSYKLAYSNDGERWKIYQDEKQGKDKDLSASPFHFPLASPYLRLKLSLPGLSYCLALVWDQIRPCCQPGLTDAMLKILFTALQQSTCPFQSPTTTETEPGCSSLSAAIRRAAGTVFPLKLKLLVFQRLVAREVVFTFSLSER